MHKLHPRRASGLVSCLNDTVIACHQAGGNRGANADTLLQHASAVNTPLSSHTQLQPHSPRGVLVEGVQRVCVGVCSSSGDARWSLGVTRLTMDGEEMGEVLS
eukprot:Hpha_TRINITY_DN16544_c0_g2::TRINITY_DN16544_c0_g2_i10::g.132416::m.132416